MSKTWTELRHLIAQQTGLFWSVGEYANDNGIPADYQLRNTTVAKYGADFINGFHVLITSPEDVATRELLVRRYTNTGDIQFLPTLDPALADIGSFEILPFSATEFLNSIRHAIYVAYDMGYLVRPHWLRIMGNSPIYNADYDAWNESPDNGLVTPDGIPDGWCIVCDDDDARLRRIQSTKDGGGFYTLFSENSVHLCTPANSELSLRLEPEWQRWLFEFHNDTIEYYCWVKRGANTTPGDIGIRLRNGSNRPDEALEVEALGTDRQWELLRVQQNIRITDPLFQPELFVRNGADAYFNFPFVQTNDTLAREYPIPLRNMPFGPTRITGGWVSANTTEAELGRRINYQVTMDNPRLLTYQHPGCPEKFGILDWTMNQSVPPEELILLLQGDGPLNAPGSILDDVYIEVTETEAVLLASMAAKHLLERASTGLSPNVIRPYTTRLEQLDMQISRLSRGAGYPRNVATYGLGW